MKSLSVVLGALTIFALGACKVTTSGGTGGGSATTSTGDGTTTTGGVGGGGGAASTATGGGGAPACDPKYTCAEAITPPNADATKLCMGPHADLYDALTMCTCSGACMTKCADNVCAGKDVTADCTACLQASAPDGCKKEFDECSNDI